MSFISPRRNSKSLIGEAVREAMEMAFENGRKKGIKDALAAKSEATAVKLTVDISAEVKACIDELKAELEQLKNSSSRVDTLKTTPQESAPVPAFNDPNIKSCADVICDDVVFDGLVKTQPEIKQMGQWVFEGQDPKWISGAVDKDGSGYLYTLSKADIGVPRVSEKQWGGQTFSSQNKQLEGVFDASDWENSAIDREAVNDMESYDDTTRADFEAEQGIAHSFENISEDIFLSDADQTRIFIQNLSTTLIQRMHALDRFSGADNIIMNNDIEPWDAVVSLEADEEGNQVFDYAHGSNMTHGIFTTVIKRRTITESEIPAFRAAMEVMYVD